MDIGGEQKNGKVAFLFKRRRSGRLEGSGPQEFFYGLPQLRRAGWAAELISDDELGLDRLPSRGILAAINHFGYVVLGIPLWALWRLSSNIVLSRLNGFDAIVVTTNTFGVCLGVLKRIGALRPELLYVAMGLVEPTTPRRIMWAYRVALRDTSISTVASADAINLSEHLRLPVTAIPFGVDTRFWHPGNDNELDYAISIGNDRHRDYVTLVKAWKPSYPKLRIVTKLPVFTSAKNIDIVRGDGYQDDLDDEQVRALVQRARFAILPIRNTVQPSGQSACLQAMACGKAVIITDFPGLWNRELLRNGETCIIAGPPGIPLGLQQAVELLTENPNVASEIGDRAMRMVRSKLNVEMMASAIETRLSLLLGSSSSAQ